MPSASGYIWMLNGHAQRMCSSGINEVDTKTMDANTADIDTVDNQLQLPNPFHSFCIVSFHVAFIYLNAHCRPLETGDQKIETETKPESC